MGMLFWQRRAVEWPVPSDRGPVLIQHGKSIFRDVSTLSSGISQGIRLRKQSNFICTTNDSFSEFSNTAKRLKIHTLHGLNKLRKKYSASFHHCYVFSCCFGLLNTLTKITGKYGSQLWIHIIYNTHLHAINFPNRRWPVSCKISEFSLPGEYRNHQRKPRKT